MLPLFVSSIPLPLQRLSARPAASPRRCVVVARKRNQKQKSRSTSSSRPSSSKSAPKHPKPPAQASPPPRPPSEPFVPRGPTLRAEYERKGIIEPELDAEAGILPEVVANRMIRRIAIFAGIPISLLTTFFIVYFVLKYKYDITVIPVVVAYSTLGTIALATGGITYGIFSCSWDDDPGSLLGWEEARTNFIRAKDGLLGAREREKREDKFEQMDREAEEERKAAKHKSDTAGD